MPSKRTGRKIVAILENKKGQQVLHFSDGSRLALSADAFTEIPLYVGKEVTPLEYRTLASFLKNESLWSYALSLGSKGCYSRHDIKAKLVKKSDDAEKIRQVLDRLGQEGLLDDESFAKQYAEEKGNLLYGKERISQELRFTHGVNETIVASLPFPHEEEHAKLAAQQLEKRLARLPLSAKKAKAVAALTRRGFSEGIARMAVEDYQEDKAKSKQTLEKLTESVVERYQRKYNGYELRAKCFAYLLSKGYRSEEIEPLLEEKL